jgi:DNA-binding NtrC family response regulator
VEWIEIAMTELHDILIVDDEGPIVEMLLEILRDEGYSVRDARNANEAFQAVSTRVPDLMLIDVRMPGIDGITFLQNLRSRGHAEMPAILMTADMQIIKQPPIAAADYLAKPFELDRLLNMISRHLSPQRD